MKTIIHNSKFIIATALVALCFACTPPDVDQSKLFLTEEQAQEFIGNGECLTIEEFKTRYMTEEGNYCLPELYRQRSKAGNYYLFSIDTIPTCNEKPVYIRGRVTTDDYAGNFYKTICIQQVFINGNDTTQQALRISLDLGSANGLYQLGQEILIRVDGLAVGRYGNQPQLCSPSYNNNIYADKADQKIGWGAGRIPAAIFKARTKCIGLPDQSKLFYEKMVITDYNNILDLEATRDMDAKLVRIENVHFTGQYYDYGKPKDCTTGDPETDKNANVFAPYTENYNYPQSRVFYDDNNNYSAISTSEYAKFAHFYLPANNYWGTIYGILGFNYDNGMKYSSNPPAADDWAISIRSLDDLQLYDDEGNLWPRIEYQDPTK